MTSTWQPSSSSEADHSNFIAADPYPIPDPNFPVYDKNYVEELRKSFIEQQTEKRVVRNDQKLGMEVAMIQKRLKGHEVAIPTLTCLSNHCGRSFDRIQVLAFHVSYAHQDLMTSHSSHLTCLLCGKKWTTVRRKIMHLSLAHRNVGEEHNSQCMQQVESVIAPNAPKAQRLQKARRDYDGFNFDETLEDVVPDEVEEAVEFDYFQA